VRILHIGDIVGRPGRHIVLRSIGELKRRHHIDLVIANAENIAGGSGITPKLYRELIAGGVHCVTLGDHIYRRREIYSVLEADEPIVKPANFPLSAPGKEWTLVTADNGVPVAVFSLLGRVFMRPVDCPFVAADRVLERVPAHVRVRWLDFHAEATSDKQLMGRYLDGRVTAVLGTHTHVPTADEQILPGGTAFQCDIGMTGPHDSVLGRRTDYVLETTTTFRPLQFDVATRDVRLHATLVEVDIESGKARAIQRIVVRSDGELNELDVDDQD
jgi:metallophosphoesterase (TIGR00282 family)